ncbi:MAG TPA: hypothetical protein V6D02_13850 [Candidatus Obscuribacterales bacterium]
MRVYTTPTMRSLIGYGKLLLGLAILVIFLTQAVKVWSNDPTLKELNNLIQPQKVD